MYKLPFISVLMVSTALFVSCSPTTSKHPTFDTQSLKQTSATPHTNKYGAYLAARVAHLRKDFDSAADYYKIAIRENNADPELLDRIYLILTSKGRIEEAALYAQESIKNNTGNSFAYLLVAAVKNKQGDYTSSIETLNKINDPIYRSFILPLFNIWNYAGLNDQKSAFAELKKLQKEDSLAPIYNLQQAMLYDYLGQNREAQQAYEQILNDKTSQVSVRMLELITNFYIRTGQKDKAVALMHATANNQSLDSLLSTLRDKTINADPKTTKPLLSSAAAGASEALFTIASTFRYDETIDVSHMYSSLAIYMNPEYSTAKILMADIFETRDMIEDANEIYDSINDTDIAYYPAQLKKSRNLVKMEDYKGAEILLKSLSEDFNDKQIDIDLGELLRMNSRYSEAIEYYDNAIKKSAPSPKLWVLYYTKGICFERMGQWQQAEEALLQAAKLKRNYLILNYLGYTWIKQNKNVDEAFKLIVEAYNKAPFDPSINDSLGFALYNMGYYGMALPYLEKASELYPSSAVISSHLGDAYWFAHRKNEAKFQWMHTLKLKDDSGEINIKETKEKIRHGIKSEPKLVFDKEKVEQIMKDIKKSKLVQKL